MKGQIFILSNKMSYRKNLFTPRVVAWKKLKIWPDLGEGETKAVRMAKKQLNIELYCFQKMKLTL